MPTVFAPYPSSRAVVRDITDPTKRLAFSLSGFTTGTTRTLTVPDQSGTLPLLERANIWTTTNRFNDSVGINQAPDASYALAVTGNQIHSPTGGTAFIVSGEAHTFYAQHNFTSNHTGTLFQFNRASSPMLRMYGEGNTQAVRIDSLAAADIPLSLYGAASQSGDMQRWNNSVGTKLAGVDADGGLTAGNSGNAFSVSAMTYVTSIRRLVATESTNINSMNVAFYYSPHMGVGLSSTAANYGAAFGANGLLNLVVNNTGYAALSPATTQAPVTGQALTVIANAATTIPVVAQGAASQTGDIFQSQNSVGTVGLAIKPGGVIDMSQSTTGYFLAAATNGFRFNDYSNALNLVIIENTGDVKFYAGGASIKARIHATTGAFVSGNTGAGSNQIFSLASAANIIPFGGMGAASQTASMFRLDNSVGTQLAGFNADCTVLTMPANFAIGDGGATSAGYYLGIAIGYAATITGNTGLALGANTTAGGQSLAAGYGSMATGITNASVGAQCVTYGTGSHAFGKQCRSNSNDIIDQGAVALGNYANATSGIVAVNAPYGFSLATTFQIQGMADSYGLYTTAYPTANLTTTWIDATTATRTARLTLSAFRVATAQEAIRIDASSDQARVGIGGAVVSGQRVTTYAGVATDIAQVLKGAASQTADYSQTQNSVGTALYKHTSGGRFDFVNPFNTSKSLAITSPHEDGRIKLQHSDGVGVYGGLVFYHGGQAIVFENYSTSICNYGAISAYVGFGGIATSPGAWGGSENALFFQMSSYSGASATCDIHTRRYTDSLNPKMAFASQAYEFWSQLDDGSSSDGSFGKSVKVFDISGSTGTPTSRVKLLTGAAGTIGQTIQGAASQTADLFRLQNSVGTGVISHTASGQLQFKAGGASSGGINIAISAAENGTGSEGGVKIGYCPNNVSAYDSPIEIGYYTQAPANRAIAIGYHCYNAVANSVRLNASQNTDGAGTALYLQGYINSGGMPTFAITTSITDTTYATLKSRAIFNAFGDSGALVECMRMEGNGTSPKLGFFGASAAARTSAYTQTYTTATRTHENPTASALTVSDGTGTNDGTIGAITADASVIAAVQELAAQVNKLVTDLANVKQVLNQVIDDHQTYGLLQ